TPSTGTGALNASTRVVYHQWGYVQDGPIPGQTIVEDAVDSFCVPGAQLFRSGGDFEIWSLSKLIGSLGGGVVWCRHMDEAVRLRKIRNSRKSSGFQWFLRTMKRFYPPALVYWFGVESGLGPLSRWGTGEVFLLLSQWSEFIADRKEKLALVSRFKPDWLPLLPDRLPCVVPVEINQITADKLVTLGMESGFRHIERVHPDGNRELVKVFPLPIHQGMPRERLGQAIAILSERH
ncbi:MAG TPA: putative PLP-dependent aminotransferase, partial [Magnetococcales bacterium]|nr:putative PLP-dependent aminotransferase [Magnetococcales bacterium]